MEYVFGLIILALLGKNYLDEKENRIEREKFIKAIMAKNLQDYHESEIINKETPIPVPPDELNMDEASDNIFDKHIKNVLEEREPDVELS